MQTTILSYCRVGWLLAALLLLGLAGRPAAAHPMPTSKLLLRVHPGRIEAVAHVPLGELQPAFGHPVADSPRAVLPHYAAALRQYLRQHVRLQAPDGRYWSTQVGRLDTTHQANPLNGPYQELTAQLTLLPPPGAGVRRFVLHDDAVLHQVVTHKVLVAVRQDWEAGQLAADDSAAAQVGVVEWDIVNSRIPPLPVNLAEGGAWRGFEALVQLGTHHIAEGTDHLLFLLALLLPAPLLLAAGGRRWGPYGGSRYALRRLLLLVTAFTVGHSLTLLLGTLGWVRLPAQPVEVLIAVSILVAAVHAVRPLFPGREAWVAGGFGLVHGLAFAGTLAELQLSGRQLALSLLGFNVGIELMQLLVVALTVPWLLLLARTLHYAPVRVGGAALAGVAALAWMVERLTGQANAVAATITRAADYAPWLLAGLALAAGLLYRRDRKKRVAAA